MKSLLTLILIGILTAGLTFWYFRPVSPSSTSVTVITNIKELEELSLVKIPYGACLKTENTVKVYVAEGFIGIDLKNSKMEKINDKKYIIHLPIPELQKDSIALKENECKIVAYQGMKKFFREYKEWKSEAINHFTEKISGNSDYIDTAKEQAEELFKTIFESQGYSVEIVWMENSDGNN